MKYFIIFAGPNGSGKSSIKSSFENCNPLFLKWGITLKDMVYVNADFCARTDPVVSQMSEGRDKDIAAWKATENWRCHALQSGESVIWETVFSHSSRLEEIKKAHRLGYYVIVIYVATLFPDINIERVKLRVKNGGHAVPEDKIISRYERTTDLLPEILMLADEAEVYDNSSSYPIPTFRKMVNASSNTFCNSVPEPSYCVFSKEDIGTKRYEWVENHIVKPLKERGCIISEIKKSSGRI